MQTKPDGKKTQKQTKKVKGEENPLKTGRQQPLHPFRKGLKKKKGKLKTTNKEH